MSRMLQRSTVKKTFITCVYRRTLAGAWWVWPTLMATAIQIISCLTQARDRRRYGILTTTFYAPVCTAPLFLSAGASWAWLTLMATASRITCFTMEARDRRRYGISIITL